MTTAQRVVLTAALTSCLGFPLAVSAGELERVVIDDNFPGAYQVEVADVDGDGKLDVIAVGGGTCAWYENPTWKKRVITGPKQSPGIISSATVDLDGDGKAEVAVAYEFSMNEPKKGKLLLASQGKGLDDPWEVTPLGDVGSVHRLRWGMFFDVLHPHVKGKSVSFDKARALAVAPIFGPSAKPPVFQEEPAHVTLLYPGKDPKTTLWASQEIGKAPVLHAIDATDIDGDTVTDVLGASNLGVTWFSLAIVAGVPVFQPITLATGAPGEAPKKGASEVHVGHLKDGRRFLATVEPWHGTDVAVYVSDSYDPRRKGAQAVLDSTTLNPPKFGARTVIDTSLKEGHALWVADIDGDGADEIFAGFRGPGTSVLMFHHDGSTWTRSVVDDKIAAQDLRGGDLDGDGKPDVVAVGGSTHNVVLYRARASK